MAIYQDESSSIECNRVRVETRKISKKPIYIKIECLDGSSMNVFKYKTSMSATVSNLEELNPKVQILDAKSCLDLGDQLKAPIVEIYTMERLQSKILSNFTNVHSINSLKINAFCFSKIITPWNFILEKQQTSLGSLRQLD